MKILRVAQHLYPEVTGGAPYHVHALSRDQAAMGNDLRSSQPGQKLMYDFEYIRRQSFWFDVKLVIRQVWKVWGGREEGCFERRSESMIGKRKLANLIQESPDRTGYRQRAGAIGGSIP